MPILEYVNTAFEKHLVYDERVSICWLGHQLLIKSGYWYCYRTYLCRRRRGLGTNPIVNQLKAVGFVVSVVIFQFILWPIALVWQAANVCFDLEPSNGFGLCVDLRYGFG